MMEVRLVQCAIVHGIGHGSLELEEVLPLTEPLTDRDKLNVGEN